LIETDGVTLHDDLYNKCEEETFGDDRPSWARAGLGGMIYARNVDKLGFLINCICNDFINNLSCCYLIAVSYAYLSCASSILSY